MTWTHMFCISSSLSRTRIQFIDLNLIARLRRSTSYNIQPSLPTQMWVALISLSCSLTMILIRFLCFCFCFTPKPGVYVSNSTTNLQFLKISFYLLVLAILTLEHTSILNNTAKGLEPSLDIFYLQIWTVILLQKIHYYKFWLTTQNTS